MRDRERPEINNTKGTIAGWLVDGWMDGSLESSQAQSVLQLIDPQIRWTGIGSAAAAAAAAERSCRSWF